MNKVVLMWKRLAVGFLFGAISVVVGLLVAEGVLRLSGAVPRETVFTVDAAEFDAVPGIFSPNQKGVQEKNARLFGSVTINNLGYRGTDIPLAKPANEFRIFMTGDSFTFGDYVHDDQTLPAQLEKELKKSCGAVRVINGGLGGSTISDQIELSRRALVLNSDLVVVVFSENDFSDLGKGKDMWRRLAENRQRKSRFPFSIVYRTLRKSAIWTLTLRVHQKMHRRVVWEQPTSGIDHNDPMKSSKTGLRDVYRNLLAQEKAILAEAGIPLFFAAYPGWATVYGDHAPEEVTSAVAIASALGVPAMDLTTTIRTSGLSVNSAFLLPDDGHPSANGYQVAATRLAEKMMMLGELATRCESREVR